MEIYKYPKSLPRSEHFKLRINGHVVETLATGVADFSICPLDASDFPAQVEISTSQLLNDVKISPHSKKISYTVEGVLIRFVLERPEKLSVNSSGGHKPFYLFATLPENNRPKPDDMDVITIPAGQITETPMLTLEDGQTLYLPGGSVLKARLHIKGKSGIRICGHGIIDGAYYDQSADGYIPTLIIECCPGAMVEDITMVRPAAWMLMLATSDGVTVRNINQIGEVISSDGIDVVGSSNVLIEDCFLHNNDDCVAIKAFHIGEKNLSQTDVDGRRNVENVLVQNCTFANWTGGNAMEIGHELAVDTITKITFRNIDVLHVHGIGAVFSIHNNDRATISDVLFEDIRIEHCYSKFIDFRISRSHYSTDQERGRMRGITLRKIRWTRSTFNSGYTVSMIGGWDAAHAVEEVVLDDIFMDGAPVRHLDDLEITTRYCSQLRLTAST